MTPEQAIRLLHPDTTAEAIAEIEYKHGFRGKQAVIHKINKACKIACKAMEKRKPGKVTVPKKGLWQCPDCGHEMFEGRSFCDECGKALYY